MDSNDRARPDLTHTGLQKVVFACFTDPIGTVDSLETHLDDHKAFLAGLESDGRLFAAGPLLDENYKFHGPGLIVYNVGSRSEAEAIARADPFHSRGVRTWRLVPWQINEGSLQVAFRLSNSTFNLA